MPASDKPVRELSVLVCAIDDGRNPERQMMIPDHTVGDMLSLMAQLGREYEEMGRMENDPLLMRPRYAAWMSSMEQLCAAMKRAGVLIRIKD